MNVGAAAVPLAVPDGTPLGGYADRTDVSAGRHDELQISCVAIESDRRALVLITVDVICINTDLAEAIAAAVAQHLPVEPDAVWTTATHTHSGPDLNCGTGTRDTPAAWRDMLATLALRAARQAWAAREPGALVWRRGELSGVGSVRANPDASPIVGVDLVSVENAGRLLGVIAVVPVHPTVLPASSAAVSGDLTAAIRTSLTARLTTAEDHPWVVVSTGCAGDVSTRFTRRNQSYAEVLRLGELAAAQLVQVLHAPPVTMSHGDVSVRTGCRKLVLPVRDDFVADVAVPSDAAAHERLVHTLRQGLAVAADRAARFPDGRLHVTVSAAQIGELRLIALSAEPYLAIRQLPKPPAVVLGYTNGYTGYLPDEEGFGRPTYESMSSPFTRDAAQTAIGAAEALLESTHPEGHA